MRTRLIDLDSSIASQPPLEALAQEGLAACIDLRASAPRLRILAARSAMRDFAAAVEAAPQPGRGAEITFYGSGDFHHLAAALVSRHDTPLTIIHIDNHPDWVTFPATHNCGAWVNRALELPQVGKIITIGPCSDDLKWPQLKSANLAAVRAGNLELFPWRAAASRLLGRDAMRWRNLADEDFDEFLDDLDTRIPTKAVYISIDKDALCASEAVTNWDQGDMRLAHVQALVESLARSRRILGIDVCGDYSPPRFSDPVRAALAWFDHPADPRPDAAALAINARANAALLDTFRRVL